jgi:serine/threonine transporter
MTTQTPPSGLLQRLAQGLVKQILTGLRRAAGWSKPAAIAVGLLVLFVGALKAVAPVLVLMLVMASITTSGKPAPDSVPVSAGNVSRRT